MAEIDGVKLSEQEIERHLHPNGRGPKFNTEQSVYYMHKDKIKRGSISSCITVKHTSDDLADLQLVSKTMALFTNKDRKQADKSGTYYITTDGIFSEDQIFTSKEHLRNSL